MCGRMTVGGAATPSFAASVALKNLSSADHQKGLLTIIVPLSAACFRNAR